MEKKYENDIMMVEIDVDKVTTETNIESWGDGYWCGNGCWGIYCQQ